MAEASSNDMHVATADKVFFGIVSAVMVAMLLWVGTTLNLSQIQIGKLQVEVAQLRNEIRRAGDDSREVNRRLNSLERDVARLKN